MSNEADTCRTYIVPNLHSAGWEDEYITEQMVLTRGRIGPSYLGSFPLARDLRQVRLMFHKGMILQSQTGEELDTLLSSVLDRAFKGEL